MELIKYRRILQRTLNTLRLHPKTLSLLENLLLNNTKSVNGILPRTFLPGLIQSLAEYENVSSSQKKSNILISLIHNIHFVWDNQPPPHIIHFAKKYASLIGIWPYEKHRDLLEMELPRKNSLRLVWGKSGREAVKMINFKRNICSVDQNMPIDKSDIVLLKTILLHYTFLQENPRLCANGKSPGIPIVEIPLKPLGEDIPNVRTKNLFKRQVANVWNQLAVVNPVLSKTSEDTLVSILSDLEDRSLNRLYRKACIRSYIVENSNDFEKISFKVSQHLL